MYNFPKNSRIAIIGAGPAGLHMAYSLKKLSYSDITIFEESDVIAPNSHTYAFQGYNFDLSTLLFETSNPQVQDFLYKGLQLSKSDLQSFDFHSLRVNYNDNVMTLSEFFLKDYNLRYKKKVEHPEYDKLFSDGIQRYKFLYNKIYAGKSIYPQEKDHEIMGKPCIEFLQDQALNPLVPLFHFLYTMNGYGNIGELSAFYCLNGVDARSLNAKGLDFSLLPHNMDYHSVFDRLVEKYDIEVNLNSKVEYVENDGSGVLIKLARTQSSTKFDRVFFATRHSPLQLIKNPSLEQIDVFSNLNYCYPAISGVVEVFKPSFKLKSADFAIISLAQEESFTLNGISDLGVAYIYSTKEALCNSNYYDNITAIMPSVRAMSKQYFNYEDFKFLYHKVWDNYFPHFSSESVSERYPWRLLEMNLDMHQNMAFIGGGVKFDTFRAIIQYNNHLLSMSDPKDKDLLPESSTQQFVTTVENKCEFYDLSSSAGKISDLQRHNSLFGNYVKKIGDINGDGFDDFYIYSPNYINSKKTLFGSPSLFVVFGNRNIFSILKVNNVDHLIKSKHVLQILSEDMDSNLPCGWEASFRKILSESVGCPFDYTTSEKNFSNILQFGTDNFGDINGDGVKDIIFYDHDNLENTKIYIKFGSYELYALRHPLSIAQNYDSLIHINNEGTEVQSLLIDINKDGFDDIAVKMGDSIFFLYGNRIKEQTIDLPSFINDNPENGFVYKSLNWPPGSMGYISSISKRLINDDSFPDLVITKNNMFMNSVLVLIAQEVDLYPYEINDFDIFGLGYGHLFYSSTSVLGQLGGVMTTKLENDNSDIIVLNPHTQKFTDAPGLYSNKNGEISILSVSYEDLEHKNITNVDGLKLFTIRGSESINFNLFSLNAELYGNKFLIATEGGFVHKKEEGDDITISGYNSMTTQGNSGAYIIDIQALKMRETKCLKFQDTSFEFSGIYSANNIGDVDGDGYEDIGIGDIQNKILYIVSGSEIDHYYTHDFFHNEL